MSDSLAGKTCPLQNGRKAGVDVGGGVERPFPVQWKLATWKWPDDPLSSHRTHPFIVWRQKRPKLFTFFLLVQCIPPEGPCSYDVCVLWGEGGVDEKQTKIVIGCVVVTVTEGSGIPKHLRTSRERGPLP